MDILGIVLIILVIFATVFLAISFLCFRLTFYVSKKQKRITEEYPLPPGKIYEPYHGVMLEWMKEVRTYPYEEMTVTSFDGLTLYGRYYECKPGAPIEIMFHGYRGSSERDLCGGVQRAFALGHSVLLVSQRASGLSGGHVISFGINESRDCRTWIEHTINRFGPTVKIILTGISMGASTVLIAAGSPLPDNVIGVLADCGYSTARDIIIKVIHQIGLPVKLLYPIIKFSAGFFGGFHLEETSPLEAVKNCCVPVIFFHGTNDDYVPFEMSRINYDACPSRKRLILVPGAGHGLCFPADQDGYLSALNEFFHSASSSI